MAHYPTDYFRLLYQDRVVTRGKFDEADQTQRLAFKVNTSVTKFVLEKTLDLVFSIASFYRDTYGLFFNFWIRHFLSRTEDLAKLV